ncbi:MULTISPECIES: intercompartmental signaling factor BofC [Bacillaceae]|uniref:intercompartmental signaling factor BofC n=1 Tax=Bacillaceae TaxID=186817 RepID=UPI001E285077|nr:MULTISPECIES: intercompartmental signaling factor BofC [Bacillaceae]MCE4046903.1 intercompartmental signaling factor BofC [Bacillus sp. Au-Bac7]MCM3030006.1 intercompartmental signaling factor BofC [Niallia sp. MER 6]MDL0436300.1 intercompartmental signaling factor BofC [Niallia sp. SS-2023]UPO86706.1 intercompartmental signaling factor BofC [Niallia sp. Man26]
MKTRFLLLFSILLIILLSASPGWGNGAHAQSPKKFSVMLQRVYLDGEVSEECVEETIWSMEDFWSKYENWQLVNMDSHQFVFRQEMDDISPLLKANGYFGVSAEGVLGVYNGKPNKSNIIQSFFQIDLEKLESKQQKNLQNGIPIKNKNRYVEVLETFKNLDTNNQAN